MAKTKKEKKTIVEGRLQIKNWSMNERKRTKTKEKKKGANEQKKLKEENQGKVQQLK